jgi:hypothetical protein
MLVGTTIPWNTHFSDFLQTFAINLTINIQITSNMQSMAMSVPKVITMRGTENRDEEPTDTVVASRIPQGSNLSELWGKVWITKFKHQQIFDSIANFDPASTTENPYNKVTIIHPAASLQPSPFLTMFVH